MRRIRAWAVGIACALGGCVDAGEEPAVSAASVGSALQLDAEGHVSADLSHVQAGQRYLFSLDQGGSHMDMVWEVTAITPGEVRYTVAVLKDGKPLSPPAEAAWEIPKPRHAPEALTKPSRLASPIYETLTLAEREWVCRVEQHGEVKTWTATVNTVETFPPLLKQTRGGQIQSLLTKIEVAN